MEQTERLDIARAVTFMFDEEDWGTKFLITVLVAILSVLIIPSFILVGYQVEIMRRTASGQSRLLPNWEEWTTYLSRGFMAWIAGVIYALPLILVICCPAFALIVAEPSGELEGLVVLLLCCMMAILFLLFIPYFMLYGAGLIRYSETLELSSFFEFGKLFAEIRENLGQYALVGVLIVAFQFVSGAIPLVGPAWYALASGQLLGQLRRLTRGVAGTSGLESAY